jgi:hypothetical protein
MNLISTQQLPDSIRSIVEEFICNHDQLSDSDEANGACTYITDLFYEIMIDDHGWDKQWLDTGHECSSWWWKGSMNPWDRSLGKLKEDIGPKTPHSFYHNNGYPGHVCARVSEKTLESGGETYFIDFTARQYNAKAPFPLIWKETWSYKNQL